MRNNPPVDPPKIGLGVLGFNFGAVHTAGAAGAASFAASAARITLVARDARDARRGVAIALVVAAYDAEADMANMSCVRKRVWRTESDATRVRVGSVAGVRRFVRRRRASRARSSSGAMGGDTTPNVRAGRVDSYSEPVSMDVRCIGVLFIAIKRTCVVV